MTQKCLSSGGGERWQIAMATIGILTMVGRDFNFFSVGDFGFYSKFAL
ncbi:MAG: hypothetical protein HDS07_00785 [Bacteroides sp.]|nr:hypothetical protein [Bacteroides sp.]